MNDQAPWATYENRLQRVSDYIHAHLDEELDSERLAEVACLSPYHWHRIYKAVHGETLASTVKRLRLHRASGEIVGTTHPIQEIARRWGYPNLQSFNRLFKAVYGMPPAQYRRKGSHTMFDPQPESESIAMYDVSIRKIPQTALVGVSHTGSYMEINRAFETLFGTLYARDLARPDMRMIGIYLDDPDIVPTDKLRSIACVTARDKIPAETPLMHRQLDGGDCAVLRHKGPYADMRKAYQWFYGTWLRQSGREVRDAPRFEEYLNNPRDVPPTDLLTEIYLPLKS